MVKLCLRRELPPSQSGGQMEWAGARGRTSGALGRFPAHAAPALPQRRVPVPVAVVALSDVSG
jgi:hypothetical protein